MSDALKSLDDVQKAITEWSGKAFVVGASTIGEIPSGYRVVVNIVSIDPNEPQMTYPTGNKRKVGNEWVDQLGLGNVALRRIASAAGLTRVTEASGRTDNGSDPDKISFVVTLSFTDMMNTIHTVSGSYEMDFPKRFEDLISSKLKSYNYSCEDREKGEAFKKRNPDGQKWAEEAARQDIIRMKVHGLQRAETGAENRAIAAALGVRRGGYVASELKNKPFAVFRLVDDIDWANDPVAHAAQIMRASGLARLMAFGGQSNAVREMLMPPARQQFVIPAAPVAADAPAANDSGIPLDPDVPAEAFVGSAADPEPQPPKQAEQKTTKAAPAAAPAAVPAPAAAPTSAAPIITEPFVTDKALPTIEAFATHPRASREWFVNHLLKTRQLKKPMTKAVGELNDADLQRWFEGLLTLPLVEGAAEAEVAK